jgi:hypothetical protein
LTIRPNVRCLALLPAIVLSAAACVSSSTTPTPDPDPGVVPAPAAVTIAADPQLSGTALTVRWESSTAASFVVHLGSAPGTADIGSFEAGTGRTYVHNNYQGRGRAFVRVHARVGDVVSSLSSETSTDVYRLREAIDSLFLANGRMSPVGNNGCGSPDRMRGFNSGAHVTVLAGSSVPDDRLATVGEFLGRVPGYTNGRLSASVTRVGSPTPIAAEGQISVSVGDPTSIGCTTSAAGCFRGFIRFLGDGYIRAEIIARADASAGIYRHELGHALLGLCHIDAVALGGNTSVMTPTVPSAADVSAVDLAVMRPVFQSSVQPGQERGAFVSAGLVDATPTFSAHPSTADLVIFGP